MCKKYPVLLFSTSSNYFKVQDSSNYFKGEKECCYQTSSLDSNPSNLPAMWPWDYIISLSLYLFMCIMESTVVPTSQRLWKLNMSLWKCHRNEMISGICLKVAIEVEKWVGSTHETRFSMSWKSLKLGIGGNRYVGFIFTFVRICDHTK